MVIPNPDLELVPEDSSSGSESSSDDDDESESDYSEVDVEADDAHVEVSTLQSWLAMIPLTKYWWEARRADRALHNIKAMHQETERARHLVGADRGKIESNAILRQIQREFRQGYHDHLLTKLPLHLEDWLAVVREDRKAARARAEAMGQNVVEEVQTAEMLAKIAEEEKRKMTCTWTHKDDASNRRYFCSNARYVCAWHANSCAGEHGMRIRTIAIPNDQALCTSCYVKEMHVPPDEISALRVPGVMIQAPQKAAHSKTRAEIEAEERALVVAEAEKACVERRANLTETTVCTRVAARDELPKGASPGRWIPDKLAPRERGLCCTNVIMADPEHGTLLPICGWHRTACVLTHQPDNDPASHYVAKYGRPPDDVGWPLPGCDLLSKVHAEMAEIMQDVIDGLFSAFSSGKKFVYGRQIKKIQCFYRRHLAARRFDALYLVQRLFRGLVIRRKARKRRDQLRLNRVGNFLYRRMQQQTVVTLQRKRRDAWRERRAKEIVHRVVLGAVGRFKAAAARRRFLEREKSQSRLASIIRGRMSRKTVAIKRKHQAKIVANTTWIQAITRSAVVKRRIHGKLMRRRWAFDTINRLGRGFICRRRAFRKRRVVDEAWAMGLEPEEEEATYDSIAEATRKTTDTWFHESDKRPFVKYDSTEVGSVSRFEFRLAMHALWRTKGLVIQPVELEPFVKMFDKYSDGSVSWKDFLNFARLSYRPCSLHRRIVCATCISRGPCQRKGCRCDAYEKDTAQLKDLVCKHCGHTPFTHMLVPKCCVEPEIDVSQVTKVQLTDIFENRSDAPMRPDAALGTAAEEEIVAQVDDRPPAPPTARNPRPSKPPTAALALEGAKVVVVRDVEHLFDDAAFEKKKPLAPVSEAVCVDRPARAKAKHAKAAASAMRAGAVTKAETQALALTTAKSFARAETETIRVTELEESMLERHFEGATQSKVELERGFRITRPIPMIFDDELRLTVKAADVYLELLDRFSDEELVVRKHEDQAFVKLIFENDVFLERHWKKLLRDVRYGKINRHLPISPERRAALESRMYPKPQQANKIDAALKRLGFHVRSSGLYGSAALAATKSTTADAAPRDDDGGAPADRFGGSRPTDFLWDKTLKLAMADDEDIAAQVERKKRAPPPRAARVEIPRRDSTESLPDGFKVDADRATTTKSVRFADKSLASSASASLASPAKSESTHRSGTRQTAASSASARSLASPAKSESTHRSGAARTARSDRSLASSKNSNRSQRGRRWDDPDKGDSDGSDDTVLEPDLPLERRSSHGDVDAKADQAAVFATAHAISTLPRASNDEVLEEPRDIRPWLCPHPGCGKVFSEKESCARHVNEAHAGRHRLAVATPTQDQFLRKYWPEEMPWEREDMLAAKAPDVAAYNCPICFMPLLTQEDLKRHLKVSHKKEEKKCYKELKAEAKKAPPKSGGRRGSGPADRRPPGAATVAGKPILVPPFCPPRRAPMAICLRHARSSFRCLDCGDARFRGGPRAPCSFYPEVTVKITQPAAKPGDLPVVADLRFLVQSERTPFVVDRETGALRHVQLVAVCVDDAAETWVCVAFLWTYEDLRRRGVDVPPDFDKQRECYEDNTVTWMRAGRIAGYCYTLMCDRLGFGNRRKADALPSHPTDMVRFANLIFDSEHGAPGPKRNLDSDADPLLVGIKPTFAVDDAHYAYAVRRRDAAVHFVRAAADRGPIEKYVGALAAILAFGAPEFLLVLDDDHEYDSRARRRRVRRRAPAAAGVRVHGPVAAEPAALQRVLPVAFGSRGVGFRRATADGLAAFHARAVAAEPLCRVVDDIVVSGFFAAMHVPVADVPGFSFKHRPWRQNKYVHETSKVKRLRSANRTLDNARCHDAIAATLRRRR
ncbi:hypothetical protein JL722_1144 [Aureococcus anophagefferens]|nr:hypothetical protein JL722_1144 [Aureococcus anophagefferens]